MMGENLFSFIWKDLKIIGDEKYTKKIAAIYHWLLFGVYDSMELGNPILSF